MPQAVQQGTETLFCHSLSWESAYDEVDTLLICRQLAADNPALFPLQQEAHKGILETRQNSWNCNCVYDVNLWVWQYCQSQAHNDAVLESGDHIGACEAYVRRAGTHRKEQALTPDVGAWRNKQAPRPDVIGQWTKPQVTIPVLGQQFR